MEFTSNDMQACAQYCAEYVHLGLYFMFPPSSINYIPGCHFAIVSFGGEGVHGCVKYNRIYISVDPFRPCNRVGLTEEPFSLRVITGRLMFDDEFRNVEFSWATLDDMEAGFAVLIGKIGRNCCFEFCSVM